MSTVAQRIGESVVGTRYAARESNESVETKLVVRSAAVASNARDVTASVSPLVILSRLTCRILADPVSVSTTLGDEGAVKLLDS